MVGIRGVALVLVLLLGVTTSASLSSMLSVNVSAAADGNSITDPTADWDRLADSFIYYRYLRKCYDQHDVGKTSEANVNAGKWFQLTGAGDFKANLGYLAAGDDKTSCGDEGVVTEANSAVGFDDNKDAFCSIQPSAKSNGGSDEDGCKDGSNDYDMDEDGTDGQKRDFGSAVQGMNADNKNIYTSGDVPGYILYIVMKKSLEQMCGGGAELTSKDTASSDGGNAATVKYVDPLSGKSTDVIYKYGGGMDDGKNIPDLYSQYDGQRDGGECNDFSTGKKNSLNQYADSFSKAVDSSLTSQVVSYYKAKFVATDELKKDVCGERPAATDPDIPSPPERAYAACVNGISSTFNAAVDKCAGEIAYKPVEERISLMKACLKKELPKYAKALDAIADPGIVDHANGDSSSKDSTTCAIDNIGWIVCPVMTFMANIIDKAYQQVASWLTVKPITTTGGGSAMYSAWVAMRDIANIAFVIAFMIIVYSQLTSAGVSNYGIKKLLPKIMVAAILVNLSYILCTIAVDISNIAGSSLYGLLGGDSFSKGIDTSHFEGDASTSDGGWVGIVGAILASATIIYLALPALIVALPTALLAIVTVFLVLALRQVLIILLIVISPLAFIALLLPNTEDWFKRWRKLFVALLVMYPIISLLFAASALASTVVMNSATDVNGDGEISLQLMGALITVLPLVLTPVVMKASAGVMNRFAGIVNNPNRGPFDAMRKRAEATAGRIRNNRDIRAVNRGGLSMRKRGLEGARKRDAIQRKRDSAVKSLDYQGSVQNYTKQANDQEKITQTAENDFETRDIQGQLDAAGLHADVRANLLNSQFSRKVAESTEKDRAEEAHIMNNRNGYQQMYAAGENLEAQKTESHNEFGRTEMGEATAQRVKAAGGEKKIIEGEHELAFQGSNVGMAQAGQMKAVDGQLDIVRGEQDINFEQSDPGIDLAVAKDNQSQRKATVTAQVEEIATAENRTVRVGAAAAQQSLAAAKAGEDAFIEELKTDAGAVQAGPEFTQVAQALQAADTIKRAQTQRSGSATNQGNIQYAEAVAAGTVLPGGTETIAQVAGGVANRGEAKALAAAKATVTQETMKNIENIQSTMPFEDSSNPARLQQMFDSAGSTEERVAILKAMYKNGSPGVRATRETLARWTSDPAADVDEIQTIKEIMQSDQGFQRAGRDFEVWSNNEHSQVDASGNRVPHASFSDVTADQTVWADISAQRFASMNKSSQDQAFQELDRVDPSGRLSASLVDRIYADSTARGQIKESALEYIRTSRNARSLPVEE